MRRTAVIADDHEGYRQALRTLLEADGHFEVIAEVSGGFEAIDLVLASAPDVLLLDLLMEDLHGVEVIRTIRSRGSKTRVLVVTSLQDEDAAINVEEAGGNGFVLKRDRHADVLVALNAIVGSHAFTAPGLSAAALANRRESRRIQRERPDPFNTLTVAEIEILRLLVQGFTSKEIGERLGKSHRTVDEQIATMSGKLGCKSRRELLRYALGRGFSSRP